MPAAEQPFEMVPEGSPRALGISLQFPGSHPTAFWPVGNLFARPLAP